jgi:hypothetical protein
MSVNLLMEACGSSAGAIRRQPLSPPALRIAKRDGHTLVTAERLYRRHQRQHDEIEAAIDWATNRVWADWFRMEQCKRIRSRMGGRSVVGCRDCPALMR